MISALQTHTVLTHGHVPATICSMRSEPEHKNSDEIEASRELTILSEVQDSPDTSQRRLAKQLGVSLGVTNLLLRTMARKGYVRVTQAGWRRWLYALTPAGFSHKVHLMAAYVHRFLNQYQRIRQTLREELEPLALHMESTVAIYGTGELAELVYLGLKELGIEEVDVFTSGIPDGSRFLGMPVREVAVMRPEYYDRVIIGFLEDTENSCEELRACGVTSEQLVTLLTGGLHGAVETEQ